jgi:predicted DNA-binding protein (MmcQ/YjbR family)
MARRRTQSASDAAVKELREFGLAYPGAHTKSPWPGHLDLAVNDKTFAYLSLEGEPFGISCKLPRSSAIALMLPFVTPAGYGLGKSGWVAAKPDPDEPIPVDMFKEWIDESYRAQAPRKLVAQLSPGAQADAGTGKSPRAAAHRAGKPAPARASAARKPARKSTARKPTAPRKPATAARKRPARR